MASSWWANSDAAAVRFEFETESVQSFHESMPGYTPGPLVELPELAGDLGVGRLFVKDESSRFGLPAFKILGASWAVARLVMSLAGGAEPVTWRGLAKAAEGLDLTLVTATDGNHGRAVAWMARQIGLRARIYVPHAISDFAAEAIASEGAHVERVDGDYDEAVRSAADFAESTTNAELVQDMSWEGYEDVPDHIVRGYGTLMREVDESLAEVGESASLVVVPVGVGSLAQAVVSHYRSVNSGARTAVLGVEPVTAACLLGSLERGQLTTVPTAPTVMAGLYCATPSTAAWEVLRVGMDAVVTVDDEAALRASDDLFALDVSSGPSGSSSLAGARVALSGRPIGEVPERRRRSALGLDADSVVVLLNTEARR